MFHQGKWVFMTSDERKRLLTDKERTESVLAAVKTASAILALTSKTLKLACKVMAQ